jgi:hypothetical protein
MNVFMSELQGKREFSFELGGLAVWHGALSFGLIALPAYDKKSKTFDDKATGFIPDLKNPIEHERGELFYHKKNAVDDDFILFNGENVGWIGSKSRFEVIGHGIPVKRLSLLLRAETMLARERFLISHYFKRAWQAELAGDTAEAQRLFVNEVAAMSGQGTLLKPIESIEDIESIAINRQNHKRSQGKRNSKNWQYILCGLWDFHLSHLRSIERVEFLEPFFDAGFKGDVQSSINTKIREYGLPKGGGEYRLPKLQRI